MAKANVRFLNVGWGDAHLIQHPSGAVSLIDGGDGTRSQKQDHPLSWMNHHGIDRLDWLILTHIHNDHLQGLLDIAKVKKVSKAILPYQPFQLPPQQYMQEQGDDFTLMVYRMLASYLELIEVLTRQGTEIKWRDHYGSSSESVIWSEEGITLSHLYPWKGDPLPAYELLQSALSSFCASTGEALTAALTRFFELSNEDSSVYRLSDQLEPTSNVLFGGDLLEAGWERLAERTDIRSKIWKVSHHGMEDGFNSRILSWIQPEHCMIPISEERAQVLQSAWNELRSSTSAVFYLTGNYEVGQACQIDLGAISVTIGDDRQRG